MTVVIKKSLEKLGNPDHPLNPIEPQPIVPAEKKAIPDAPRNSGQFPIKKTRTSDDIREEIEQKMLAEEMLPLAKRLRADAKAMAKYRRIASNPQVQSLAAEWDREIIDFCGLARKEFGIAGSCDQ